MARVNQTIKKKKQQKRRQKIVLLTFLFIFIFLIGFGGVYIYNLLNSTEKVDISKDDEELGIHEDIVEQKEIINIALFGVDKRDNSELGRSDSIIILTVDTINNKLKLSSIMRDSYVSIDGHGDDKLTHAHSFGGPQLAIKTLNQNFKLNIKDFVSVDFSGLEDIIDAIGGIPIDVKDEEVKHLNANVKEQAKLRGVSPSYIDKSGTQVLDGMQAVGYARIRATAGGDFERTDRQRTVLEGVFTKVKTAGLSEYPSMVKNLLPLVKTSLSSSEIIKLGTQVFSIGMSTIEQARFPLDEHSNGGFIGSGWYLQFDKEETVDAMNNYIFQDISPSSN